MNNVEEEEEGMCGSWEGTEGIPFICTDEEPTGRREEESDVLETGGTRTSCSALRCIIKEDGGGRGGLTSSFPFLPLLLLLS